MRRGARRLLAVPVAVAALIVCLGHPAPAGPPRRAVLILAPGISLEDALADPVLSAVAAGGGVGLMTTRAEEDTPQAAVRAMLGGSPDGDARALVRAAEDAGVAATAASRPAPAPDEGLLVVQTSAPASDAVRAVLAGAGDAPLTMVVAFPFPSPGMRARGESATPLILAGGRPGEIAEGGGRIAGLTSRTTRREGVVANVDVAPTVLASLAVPAPARMEGNPVRLEGDPPVGLHRRYLGARGIRFPLQLAMLGVGIGALLATALLLARPLRAPAVARATGVWLLLGIAIPVAAYPVGALPRIEWATAVPVVVLVAGALAAAGWRLDRVEPTAAPALVGGIAISLLALDSLQGWRAAATPVVGGGVLDGVRFFGLGNLWGGVLLGGAVLVAAHLPTWGGIALLAGAGLFAGLPGLGANLGVAVALFAAAGLWAGLRARRRLGPAEIALAGGVTAAGTALVVAAHRLAGPGVSHVARAVGEGRDLVSIAADRLRINLEVTSGVPPAWLVPAALAVLAAAAWRRWGSLRFRPEWRDACLTLALAALVGFVVNDTGIAVAGGAFGFLAVAVAYPALWERWTSA